MQLGLGKGSRAPPERERELISESRASPPKYSRHLISIHELAAATPSLRRTIATVPRVRSSSSMFAAVSENALVSILVSIGGFAEALQKQQPAQLVEVVGDEIGGGCENRTHDRSFAG